MRRNVSLVAIGIVFLCGSVLVPFATVYADTSPPTLGDAFLIGVDWNWQQLSRGETTPALLQNPRQGTLHTWYGVAVRTADPESGVSDVEVWALEPPYDWGANVVAQTNYQDGMYFEQEGNAFRLNDFIPNPQRSVKYKIHVKSTNQAGLVTEQSFWGIWGNPQGVFSLFKDGQWIPVGTESVVYLPMLSLNFKFEATDYGGDVQRVQVVVKSQAGTVLKDFDLAEMTPDETWTGTYTVPVSGRYEVTGYVWVSGQQFQKMSILIDFGWSLPDVNGKMIVSLSLAGVGILCIVAGAKPIYRRKT